MVLTKYEFRNGSLRSPESSVEAVVLLGPQRFQPALASVLESLGVAGPVAVVTAGWQEREGEVEELQAHLGRPTINVALYQRYEDVVARDRELGRALRRRQDRLHEIQELYRLRLAHGLEAARELMRRRGSADLLLAEQHSAIAALRALDAGHLRRILGVHAEFEETWRPAERDAVARHLREITALLAGAAVLAVAGGHVAVLLNRMRLFNPLPRIAGRPIVAWSAGAMALGERVVLFHDNPPQGSGNAEVLDAGLGLVRGVLPLPDASRRLRLGDPGRVSLLARRFAPAACWALDPGTRLECRDGIWSAGPGTMRLDPQGQLVPAREGSRA
jgi:hypothetical protein